MSRFTLSRHFATKSKVLGDDLGVTRNEPIGRQPGPFVQHGLRQSDLPEIGSQGVVSEILVGKRELNIRQVRALSERFGVSAATFI